MGTSVSGVAAVVVVAAAIVTGTWGATKAATSPVPAPGKMVGVTGERETGVGSDGDNIGVDVETGVVVAAGDAIKVVTAGESAGDGVPSPKNEGKVTTA